MTRLLPYIFLLLAPAISHAQLVKADTAYVADSTEDYEDQEDMYDADTATTESDTSIFFLHAIPKAIPADSLAALKSRKEFAYMQYIDSVFRHKKPKQERKPEEQVKEAKSIFNNNFLRTFYWLLAITVVVFLLLRMFIGRGALFAFNKRLKKAVSPTAATMEMEASSASHLDIAIAKGNYRQAVRILYLQCIEELNTKKQIRVSTQKTNLQYLQEIQDKSIRDKFSQLTLYYEYVWFGNFDPTVAQFNTIQTAFQSFTQNLAKPL